MMYKIGMRGRGGGKNRSLGDRSGVNNLFLLESVFQGFVHCWCPR